MEERSNNHVKQRSENLKTQYTFNGTVCEFEFGKPIRLPYIKKPRYSHHHQNSLEKESFQSNMNNQTNSRLDRPRESTMNPQTELPSQLDLMTLEEIQLCQNIVGSGASSLEKARSRSKNKFLPKINFHLKKQSSSELRMDRINSEQSIMTKLQFWERLQNYNIGPIIGRGSYSTVRLGKNCQRKKFAIKIYPQSKLADGDRKKNLEREIEILYQVSHPNLLKIEETIHTEENIYIVTELLQNTSIQNYIKSMASQNHKALSSTAGSVVGSCTNIQINPNIISSSLNTVKKLSQSQVRAIIKQVFDGFAYLHAKDIVHRDVKMENILITDTPKLNVKIIDFGFSVKLKKGEVLYDFCGTPHYIAPEVARKKGYYGKEADVWSLGVLLYRISIGSFPFKGTSQKNLFTKIIKGDYKFPNSCQISSQLTELIKLMLNPDWEKRPSIQQLLQNQWFQQEEVKDEK